MSKTKIALIQMKMTSDLKKNTTQAISKIKIAAKRGAKVVCLPELFLTKYFCQIERHKNFNYAEKIPGPSSNLFSSLGTLTTSDGNTVTSSLTSFAGGEMIAPYASISNTSQTYFSFFLIFYFPIIFVIN